MKKVERPVAQFPIAESVGPGDWFHFPNGCIHQEISITDVVFLKNTIAGENIMPFLTEDLEGFDIKRFEDLILAQYYIKEKAATLHHIDMKAYPLCEI